MSYARPVPRKGYVITAVRWDADGRVIYTKYEKPGRADHVPEAGQMVPPSRGLASIEPPRPKPEQRDLF